MKEENQSVELPGKGLDNLTENVSTPPFTVASLGGGRLRLRGLGILSC